LGISILGVELLDFATTATSACFGIKVNAPGPPSLSFVKGFKIKKATMAALAPKKA